MENEEEVKVDEVVEPKKLEEMSAEELKAEAERIEALLKDDKGEKVDEKSDDYKKNMLIRAQKAQEKLDRKNGTQKEPSNEATLNTIDVDDRITLSENKIKKDSEQAKILEKYKKAGIIKSYEEGLNHTGIKAEFAEIEARNTAETVIDENDRNGEQYTKTSKEIVRNYKETGEVPQDPTAQAIIVEDNLKGMGL